MSNLQCTAGFFLLGAASILASGCIRGDSANYFHVSGAVKFDGAPVPAGRISFTPDTTKDNTGPQIHADIDKGVFNTRAGNQGHLGGAMIVMIYGFDGNATEDLPMGTPLFKPYEIKLDLPKETTVQNLEIPASAAEGLVITKPQRLP